jgi:2-polyprenyl-3-methyl-5-hydroxy-6-metoxy-1,4-benzoquinol methylase/glycosyltransferase involved in cell wall biosynthesis
MTSVVSDTKQPAPQWVFFATNAKPSSMRRALAYNLSERQPVVIITEPLSALRQRRCPPFAERLVKPAGLPNLREYTPIHFPERIPLVGHRLKGYGRKMLRGELGRVLAPFGPGRRVVCYDSPGQYPLVGTLEEDRSVYLAVDDRLVTVAGEPIKGEDAAERELLRRVERVICVSEPLAATLRSRSAAARHLPIEVLSNGYDGRLFDPDRLCAQPAGLAEVPRPRILVAGHVSERIDWAGIAAVAALRPAWSWVFVGPADPRMAGWIASISAKTGARLVLREPVPHAAVPAWIAHCEACAVPYRLNAFTRASSPLKALEYLAMGAPMLATDIPSLSVFAEALFPVREGDGASYAAALDGAAMQGRSDEAVERRRSSVANENWAAKVERFCKMLEAPGDVQVALPGSSRRSAPANAGAAVRLTTQVVTRCDLCGGSRFAPELQVGTWHLVRCVDCGLVCTSPRYSPETIAELYKTDYYRMADAYYATQIGPPSGDDLGFARAVAKIVGRAGKRSLDMGCGAGRLVEAFHLAGLNASGIEPNEMAVAAGQGRGRDIDTTKLSEVPDGSFDCVTAMHVLEHTHSPKEFLAHCRRILANRGLLIVEVPNYGSRAARRLRQHWRPLYPDTHLYQFTPQTLTEYFRLSGLRVRALQRLGGAGFLHNAASSIRDDSSGAQLGRASFKEKLGDRIWGMRHALYRVPHARVAARHLFLHVLKQGEFIRMRAEKL